MIQYLKGFKEIFIIPIKFLFSLLQNNCKYMELIKKKSWKFRNVYLFYLMNINI